MVPRVLATRWHSGVHKSRPQSVQHVVVDCVIHKAPDGFADFRRLDAATRSWLEDLNIDIWRTGRRLYIPPSTAQWREHNMSLFARNKYWVIVAIHQCLWFDVVVVFRRVYSPPRSVAVTRTILKDMWPLGFTHSCLTSFQTGSSCNVWPTRNKVWQASLQPIGFEEQDVQVLGVTWVLRRLGQLVAFEATLAKCVLRWHWQHGRCCVRGDMVLLC